MLLRSYKNCVENGYTADQYAEAWAPDLYRQTFYQAVEYFWGDHSDLDLKYEDQLNIPQEIEMECVEECRKAYKTAYLRYQKEMEDPSLEVDPFEDWEVDQVVGVILDVVIDNFNYQLRKILEKEGKEI